MQRSEVRLLSPRPFFCLLPIPRLAVNLSRGTAQLMLLGFYGILWIASEEPKRVVVPLGLYCFVVRVYAPVWELALGANH